MLRKYIAIATSKPWAILMKLDTKKNHNVWTFVHITRRMQFQNVWRSFIKVWVFMQNTFLFATAPVFLYPRNKVVGGGGGVYWNQIVRPSFRLSVCPPICRCHGFRALGRYPYHLESPYHTYGLPWEENIPYWFWGEKIKGQAHWTLK
jgi:hypothetical protein